MTVKQCELFIGSNFLMRKSFPIVNLEELALFLSVVVYVAEVKERLKNQLLSQLV